MSDISKRARSALAEVRKYNVHPRLDVIAAALDRLAELEKEVALAWADCKLGDCDACAWCCDEWKRKAAAYETTGAHVHDVLLVVVNERDALKARVEELEAKREVEERDRERSDNAVSSELGKLYMEVDRLRADALAHMELAGQLRAQIQELDAENHAKTRALMNKDARIHELKVMACTDGVSIGCLVEEAERAKQECDALRAQLAEADRLIQTVLNDVERCKQNNVVWPSTVRMLKAHLEEEPAKKVIRRADTPESRAFWAQAEKEGGE